MRLQHGVGADNFVKAPIGKHSGSNKENDPFRFLIGTKRTLKKRRIFLL